MLSHCHLGALPVLPALLSASGVGGRRRPLGVVLGLGVTFAVTIIVIDKVVGNVAIGQNAPRYIAIVVLILVISAVLDLLLQHQGQP